MRQDFLKQPNAAHDLLHEPKLLSALVSHLLSLRNGVVTAKILLLFLLQAVDFVLCSPVPP